MNKINKDTSDIKWEKFMRYLDLAFKYWDIEKKLWREYPGKMNGLMKNRAEIWLNRGLIKCNHEQ